jgi:hypothetical protein
MPAFCDLLFAAYAFIVAAFLNDFVDVFRIGVTIDFAIEQNAGVFGLEVF